MMPLVLRKQEGETWREAMVRIASDWGLEQECVEQYDREVRLGVTESCAAFCALYDWDCLDYEEDEEPDHYCPDHWVPPTDDTVSMCGHCGSDVSEEPYAKEHGTVTRGGGE